MASVLETPVPARPSPRRRSRASRAGFTALGLVFLTLAIVGIWVPVLPTTINAILALACFKRGNERLETWLLNHRVIGPTLCDWEETRSVTRRTKLVAITMIWITIGVSCLFVRKPWVLLMLPSIALALTIYLWTRKTKPATSG
jgi:uncharacterized membrane protein YbaN (DUF454 family)